MDEIKIKQGDITQEDVDVIVNAANTTLRGGGGVDGVIHRAAGSTVLVECIKISGCDTGDAVMTNSGRLKAKRIIHTVGPVWNGGKKHEPELLRGCYRNSFKLARQENFKSIAFPAISTGAYGYPIEPAAEIALREGMHFQNDFDEIRFVCFSKADLEAYQKIYVELNNKNK